MKILIIHNHYLDMGGEDAVVAAEAKLLQEHGHKVILYEKSNASINKLPFIKKIFFMLSESKFSKVAYQEVRKIIDKEKPDVAHIHNIFFCITPSVYLALKEGNVPIVQSMHNFRFFCLKGTFFNKGTVCEKCKNRRFFNAVLGRCWRNSFILSFFLVRLLYKAKDFLENIDSFIVLSEFSRDKLIEYGLDKQKMHLKTNFLTVVPDTDIKDGNYALFVGRLVDYKGIETLLEAVEINPSFNLKIIGDGPLRRNVRDFVSSRKNIEFLGRVGRERVFGAIKNSSFLIFPSQCYENMPMVIIESFAFSKPVLAGNVGAVKELIIDEVNGLLFNSNSAQDLAAKASYLFLHKDERVKMGENANRFYRERFNRENNYQILIDIYKETINSKQKGLYAK